MMDCIVSRRDWWQLRWTLNLLFHFFFFIFIFFIFPFLISVLFLSYLEQNMSSVVSLWNLPLNQSVWAICVTQHLTALSQYQTFPWLWLRKQRIQCGGSPQAYYGPKCGRLYALPDGGGWRCLQKTVLPVHKEQYYTWWGKIYLSGSCPLVAM